MGCDRGSPDKVQPALRRMAEPDGFEAMRGPRIGGRSNEVSHHA